MCDKHDDLVRALAKLSPAEFSDIVKFARRSMESKVRYTFKLGDRVTFDTRQGRRVTGILIGRGPRNLQILADDKMRWRVNPLLACPEGA